MKEINQSNEPLSLNFDFKYKVKDVNIKKQYIYICENVKNIEINFLKNSSFELILLFLEDNYKDIKINSNIEKEVEFKITKVIVSKKIELEETVSLFKEGSKVKQETLIFSKESAKQIINFEYNNLTKNTDMDQKVIVIGDKNSKTRVNCTGKIDKNAPKSKNTQSLKGLSQDNASIELDPILLIDNYDVVASHSASSGNLLEDEIYYLKTRGLRESEAKKLILDSYINPIIKKIDNDKVLKDIENKITK